MRVYGRHRMKRIEESADLVPGIISTKTINRLQECEVIFSTWGMPVLNVSQVEAMPRLRAVFYAAGSAKYFAEPFLKRGVKVVSAWAENAKPTAAFALGQVLLSCKGYFRNARDYREAKDGVWNIVKDGIYGCKVGIIGAGKVGRRLIELLGNFGVEIYVADPYLTAAQAKKLGARKTDIKTIFRECLVVSNHMPDIEETKGSFDAGLFSLMPKNATFINTGRGAQVCENGLAGVLRKRRDLTALLDVTYPEPPAKSSELFKLPNVIISPHIAGAYGKEQGLLADCVMGEFEAMLKGKPLKYEISLQMLKNMA
jgi:phosphoglycerate dehydrogenase-like enzyme